jgi:hypothetical protein
MWNWILNNKEWLFSGVGVAAIVSLVGFLSRRKSASRQKQRSGRNSTNIQAGRDVTITNPPPTDDR